MLLPAALALAGSLPALQTVYVPDAKAGSGAVNSIPLGSKGPTGPFQNMRTQIRVPASFLPKGGSTITDLGFAAGGTGAYTYKAIVVRLAHLKGTKMSSVFADNLAGPVEVLNATSFKYAFPKADSFHALGLRGSFKHDGTRDLVVDVVVQGAFFNGNTPGSRRSSSLETVFALSYDLKNPAKSGFGPYPQGAKLMLVLSGGKVVTFGTGCKGSDGKVPAIAFGGAPVLGQTLNVHLTNGKATSAALLLLGGSDTKYGAIPLPLSLAPLGAPGCSLLTEILLSLSGATSSTGGLTLGLPIPNDTKLRGKLLVGQWAVLDGKANALGFAFSNGAKATVR